MFLNFTPDEDKEIGYDKTKKNNCSGFWLQEKYTCYFSWGYRGIGRSMGESYWQCSAIVT